MVSTDIAQTERIIVTRYAGSHGVPCVQFNNAERREWISMTIAEFNQVMQALHESGDVYPDGTLKLRHTDG
jgi:hypothetical protein